MLTTLTLSLNCLPEKGDDKPCHHKERQAFYRLSGIDPNTAETVFQRIEDYATEQLVAFMGTVAKTSHKTGYRV